MSALSLDGEDHHMQEEKHISKEEKKTKEEKEIKSLDMSDDKSIESGYKIYTMEGLYTDVDGKPILIQKKYLVRSELANTMIEGDKETNELHFPNVKLAIFLKALAFIVHYVDKDPLKEMQKPLTSNNMEEIVGKWYAEYIDVEDDMVFELILAANYLDIKPLLDLTCCKVASIIKGKSPEELRKRFNIVCDFTKEEEEAVRAENKWAFE